VADLCEAGGASAVHARAMRLLFDWDGSSPYFFALVVEIPLAYSSDSANVFAQPS